MMLTLERPGTATEIVDVATRREFIVGGVSLAALLVAGCGDDGADGADVAVQAYDKPAWAALPAVRAGQLHTWSAETVLSHRGFSEAVAALAGTVRNARGRRVMPAPGCDRPVRAQAMGGERAVVAEGLVKRFGSTVALDGVDLAVPAGAVVGLLGPNGAGKTTVVRILATLLAADEGRAVVAGHDVAAEPDAVRRSLGLTGQFAAVDDALSGRENLVWFGRLRGLAKRAAGERAGELLAGFDLSEAADERVKSYSGGMRRRLDLAVSLVVQPEVLVLDEPTTGLDPRSRLALWDVVAGLRDRGVAVLLTTQYLEEADRLADRITVVDRGRVIAEGTARSSRSGWAVLPSRSWPPIAPTCRRSVRWWRGSPAPNRPSTPGRLG